MPVQISANLDRSSHTSSIRGYIESVAGGVVSGWLVDLDAPSEPVHLEITLAGRVVRSWMTAFGRPDIDQVLGSRTCSRLVWPNLRGDLMEEAFERGDDLLTIVAHRAWEAPAEGGVLPLSEQARMGLLAEIEAARGQLGAIKIRNLHQAITLGHPVLSRLVDEQRIGDDVFRRSGHVLAFSDYAFDAHQFYLNSSNGSEWATSALGRHLSSGGRTRVAPPLLDVEGYLKDYPDIEAVKDDPLVHYLRWGGREGRTVRLRKGAPSAQATLHRQLLPVTLGARPELSPEQRALLLAWFDRRRATVLASLSNGAWRGAEPIAPSDRFYGALSAARVEVEPAFEAGSQIITEKYYAPSAYADPDLTVSNLVVELRARLRRAPTARAPSPALLEGGVSVITPYFRHRRFFPECAASVALMFEITRSVSETALEWVVINDDPSMTAADLLSMVPAALRNRTRIIDGGGMGTTRATNAGIEAARHGWLLFLDCDDMILPDAVVVMDHYARTQGGRYFSSALIDIDEDGRVIRYRPHLKPPGRAPAAGMIAGHLKAVHRSAFTDLGELNPLFDSCQDYDFLLRVLEAEDVILVPEYLYQYRWHDQTQSVSKVFEQERRVLEIKKVFVEGRQASVRDCPSGPAHTAGRIRIGAVIRSTGERTLSLLEAIASCRTLSDAIVIRPIVVVHGDDARVDFVRDLLARHGHGPETLDLLQAGEPDRLRGYPLNVGAEHALTVAGCHAFGILDDDDVYLPGMELMAFLAADDRPLVLAGRTLCRGLDGDVEELYPLLPSAVLLKQNFLPTNGVLFNAAAAGAVKERFGSMFPEDMHYLEDWVFLIRAIAADVPYRFFDRFVGEFRMGSDGNTGLRRRPFEFEKCTVKAHTLARQVARDMGARLEPHVVNLPQKLAGRMSADEVELALAWTAQSV